MDICLYQSADIDEIAQLFYNTIHTINAKDYSKEQLNVWADGNIDTHEWDISFKEHYSIVAKEDNMIIAFADLDGDYLDRLYVHSDYQGRGVATAMCTAIHAQAMLNKAENIFTHASITAVPFFEHIGYKIVKEQQVERGGVMLTNFFMQKPLGKILV